jgi:hypothetical protein
MRFQIFILRRITGRVNPSSVAPTDFVGINFSKTRKISFELWNIVDTFFWPEKLRGKFREILTTLFQPSSHRRNCDGNTIVRFFLL